MERSLFEWFFLERLEWSLFNIEARSPDDAVKVERASKAVASQGDSSWRGLLDCVDVKAPPRM